MLELERKRGEGVFSPRRPIICLARLGHPDYRVVVTRLEDALNLDLGDPPHSIIVPAKLSHIEAEILLREFNADTEIIHELASR